MENAVRIAIRIDLRDLGWRQDAVRTYSPEGPLPMKCCSYVRWHHGSSIPAASLSSKPRLARKYSLVTAMPLQAYFFRARAHWRSCAKIGARLSVIRCSGAQTLHAARGCFRRMGNLLQRKAMPRRKSPRDARCEHKRHVKCAPTSKATPRKWERARCKHCHRSFHSSNALRVHVSTQHPSEYRPTA